MASAHTSIDALIPRLFAAAESDFYRRIWGRSAAFDELPTVTRRDFLETPLSKRRYKNERSFVKIVHDGPEAFLSEWAFNDIGQEHFGLPSKRPMVYLEDSHEAIEKSMWCYENNMLPLVGEKDPDMAMFAGEKYHIDSLITDPVSLPKLRPFLERLAAPLESISILGTSFTSSALLPFAPYARSIRLVLCLPEVGAFAEAPLAETPRFQPLPECIVETAEHLIVSKERALVTPIVRYRTDIPRALYYGA